MKIFCLYRVSTESLSNLNFRVLMLFCFCSTIHWLLYASMRSCMALACCSFSWVLSLSFYCKSEILCSFSASFRAISERYLVNSSANFCCSLVSNVILVCKSYFSLKTCSFSSLSFFSCDENVKAKSFWNFSFSYWSFSWNLTSCS